MAQPRTPASARTPITTWNVQYEADVLPTAATPAWTKSGEFTTEEINPAGYLHIAETISSSDYKLLDNFSSSTGIAVEFKAILNDVKAGEDIFEDYFSIYVETELGYVELGLVDNKIWTRSQTITKEYSLNTSVEHTYRFIKYGTEITTYVDDEIAIQFTETGVELVTPAPNITMFLRNAEATIDYCYYSLAYERASASGRTAVGSWTSQYEADVLPIYANPVWDRQLGIVPDTEEIVDGTLHLAHTGFAGYERSGLTIPGNVTLETRFKLVDGTMSFDLGNDDTGYYWVDIASTGVTVNGDTTSTSYSMDTTTDFRIYRLSIDNNVAKLYVDGSLRITLDDAGAGFGGYYSIYIQVPEPPTPGDGYYDYVYFSTGDSFPRTDP